MKPIKTIFVLTLVAGFANAQKLTVHGTTKLNTDFGKYRTYSWVKADETMQATEYDLYSFAEEAPGSGTARSNRAGKTKPGSRYIYQYDVIIPSTIPSVNTTVRNAISAELEGRGYSQSANPDLLVAYRVLEGKARMKGYTTDTPTMVGANEVHQPGDTTTFVLQRGTLVISLIDRKTSAVVWDGFASGLYNNNRFVSDDIKIKEAVNLIMAEFKYRGDKANR